MQLFTFGFLRVRRARTVVEGVIPSVPEGVQLLSRVDRAATLGIANSMLQVGAEEWGDEVLQAPARMQPRRAAEAVLVLAGHHVRLRTEALEPMQRRNMDDIAYAQAMRELRAVELVIATLGAVLLDTKPAGTRAAWKLLWDARDRHLDGAKALADFARHAKASPVLRPKSRRGKLTPAELVTLCSTLPPFLSAKGGEGNASAKPAARPVGKEAGGKATGRAPAGTATGKQGAAPQARVQQARAPAAAQAEPRRVVPRPDPAGTRKGAAAGNP